MVFDNINNSGLYFGMCKGIEKALKYLQQTDFTEVEPGKYEIVGMDIYALVQEYDSKLITFGKWEAHKEYIDVQYVVSGLEQMGYAYGKDLEIVEEYNADGDYTLYKGNGSMIVAKAGTFAIFGPEDAHMPGVAVNAPSFVKKVVVKVKV